MEEFDIKEEKEFIIVKTNKEDDIRDCEMLEFGENERELMLHVMREVVEPHTLKIKGTIIGLPILALIDGEASHNFLLEDVANKLGLNEVNKNSF